MNKHSIDDFFAERLSNHEIKPSSRAFEMFEEKISEKENKKKGVFWILPGLNLYYYGAAACILLLLGFFWFQPESEKNTFADNSKASSVHNADAQSKENGINETIKIAKENNDLIISNSLSKVKSGESSLIPKSNSSTYAKQSELKTINPIAHFEIDEPIKDNLYLALDNNSTIAQNTEPIKSSNIFNNDIGETLVVISAIDAKEERVSIPTVNSDSDLTLAEAKSYQNKNSLDSNDGILAKVFTEIKHFKHGEKVDVNEIVSDFNLNEESFIVSETRQIKEKWSQIKNILARN
jgi:hypothetical protein